MNDVMILNYIRAALLDPIMMFPFVILGAILVFVVDTVERKRRKT